MYFCHCSPNQVCTDRQNSEDSSKSDATSCFVPLCILILRCRTWVAISYGLLLSCLHTVLSVVLLDSELLLVNKWQTVAANILVLLTVNLVGIFIHNLTEEGQRRAFLDTRDCIAARLEMEDENEKLVSTTALHLNFKRWS